MSNKPPRNILFIHQGHELYGSDRSLIRNIRAALSKYPESCISVILPKEGALSKAIGDEFGIKVQLQNLGVLRKYDLKRLNFNIIPRLLTFFRHIRYFNRFDIVYINSMVVIDCILAARYTHANVIIHIREIPVGLQRIVFSWLIKFSGATLVFVSEAAKKSFSKLSNPYQHVLWNGCVAIGSNSSPGDDLLHLLMIGRISTGKGQKLLLEALHNIPAEHRAKVRLTIMGDVYGKQQSLMIKLLQSITQLGLQQQIKIVPFNSNPSEAYHRADAIVIPSLTPESFGLVAIEAMSAGKPVIAANHGGLTEIVVHNETGLLFEPGNPTSLADAILFAIQTPQKMQQMGVAGKKRYEEHFTEEIYIRNFQRIV